MILVAVREKKKRGSPGELDLPGDPCQSSCVHGRYDNYYVEQLPPMLSNEFLKG